MSNYDTDTGLRLSALQEATRNEGRGADGTATVERAQAYYDFLTEKLEQRHAGSNGDRVTNVIVQNIHPGDGTPQDLAAEVDRGMRLRNARKDQAEAARLRHHKAVKRERIRNEFMATVHEAGIFADPVLLSDAVAKAVKDAKLLGEA